MWRDFDRFPRLPYNLTGMVSNNLPLGSDIVPRRRRQERGNALVQWYVLSGAGP